MHSSKAHCFALSSRALCFRAEPEPGGSLFVDKLEALCFCTELLCSLFCAELEGSMFCAEFEGSLFCAWLEGSLFCAEPESGGSLFVDKLEALCLG